MRFLIRLLLIVLVAIAIGIAGLLMLPGERIASIAQTQLSKQLGRDVRISSETSVSLYPILGVTTGPASIASAEWAKNGPLFTSDSLSIGVDVLALIGGTIRITKLEASGPRIILERASDGRTNWDFFETAPAPQPSTAPQPESGEASTQKFDLSLERALITNGGLRYIDHGTGTDQDIPEVDIDLTWPSQGGPAQLALGVVPFGERIELNTTLANVLDLIGGDQTALSGTLATAGADIAFEGIASIKPEAAMQINGTIPKAGDVLRALGQNLTELGLSPDFNPNVEINSQVSFDGTRLALRKMDVDLDESTVSGDVDLVLALGAPQVTAKLQATVKNAGQLMRQLGQPPEALGLGANFDPNLSSAIALTVNGGNINAKLTDLTASLDGATASGDADIKISQNTPDIAANLAINAPNLAQAAQALGQPLSNFGLASIAQPSIKANVSAQMRQGDIDAKLRNVVATLAGANVAGDVDIALSNSQPNVSGELTAVIPNTAQLLSALGQSAVALPKGFGQAINTKSKLSFKSNKLNLTGLSIALDQNTFSGNVALDLGPSVPSVTAQLQAGDLDFSALNPDEPSDTKTSAGSGWSKDRIDASALSFINGSVSLQARSINLGKIKLGAADLGVAIDRARAVVSINRLSAYQGQFAGQLVANNRNGLSVGGDLSANSVALGPLLTALAGIDKVTGNSNLNLKFLGVGNSVDAIMRSLSGNLGLSIPQGNVGGLDLESLILQGNANARLTPFNNLQATGTMNNGRLVSEDFTVSTGRVDARGKGYVDLGAQTMDYLLTPIAKEVGNAGNIEIPVRIKGPWSNLTIRPDLEAALNLEAERKALEERARQELEREKQKLKDKADAEADRLRAQAQAEAKKLEDKARKELEDAARRAAEDAAKRLNLDKTRQQQLENAAKNALENELSKGLKNLLGGN